MPSLCGLLHERINGNVGIHYKLLPELRQEVGGIEMAEAKIEEFSPIGGQFFLITKNKKLLGKAWDAESARIIAAAFDQAESAWNTRAAEPEARALTLQELREMDMQAKDFSSLRIS